MNSFDFPRFNGFMREGLDDLLFKDIWNYDVFNESDLHSAAYYYIRGYFRKQGRSRIYVRCEPKLAGMKPDIVVYDRALPIYVVEFKFFPKPEALNEEAIFDDLDKLAHMVDRFVSVKWGFFYLVHDGESTYSLSDAALRRRDYERISFSTINMRRKEGSDRRRTGYDDWRAEYDELLEKHRACAV